MRKITKRSAAIVAASAVAAGGAGAAWAAWTLNGSVDASATAGKAKPIVVSAPLVAGTLAPGSVHDVTFSAANPNDFPVTISTIIFSNIVSDEAHKACIGPDNVKQAATTLPAKSNATLPAKGSGSFTVPHSLRMVVEPADACQEAKFTFKLTANATSASGALSSTSGSAG